jgi:hypothetical protein
MNSSIGLAAHLAIGNGRSAMDSQPAISSSRANASALEGRANDGSTSSGSALSTSGTSHANANAKTDAIAIAIANTKTKINRPTDMANTTPTNVSASGLTQRRNKNEPAKDAVPTTDGDDDDDDDNRIEPQHDDATIQQLRKAFQRKYRHVAAIHSKTQPSCLSHDSAVSPSFLGFRNLMVIVLGALAHMQLMNLRNGAPILTISQSPATCVSCLRTSKR